jgi:heme-degrading monooxygenase HmoA
MHPGSAKTPEPPYYAVIFTPTRTSGDHGYAAMVDGMADLALQQPSNLGTDSSRGADGLGITVSYWQGEASTKAWKAQTRHAAGQWTGMTKWYDHYKVHMAKIERAFTGPEGRSKP